jgi:hypothetical protein
MMYLLLLLFAVAIIESSCFTSRKALEHDSSLIYLQDKTFPKTGSFQYKNPSWITISPDGSELYLLQQGMPAVSVWDLEGNLLRIWSTKELGLPHSLRFQVRKDGTEFIWITDMAPPTIAGVGFGHCLKQFSKDGNYLGSIGICGQNSQGKALDPVQFDKVTDIGFSRSGNLWVSDGDMDGLNNRILEISANGDVLQAWSAPSDMPGSSPKEFNLPHTIEIDACDRIYIADTLNHRVQILRTDGTFLQELSCFNTEGVYGLSLSRFSSKYANLFVSSNQSEKPITGIVRAFLVDTDCSASLPVLNGCKTTSTWQIDLPEEDSQAILHSLSLQPDGNALYIAILGGKLPLQKWVRTSAPQ